MSEVLTIACVLYQGKDVPAHSHGIFTAEWADRLYRGVKRNTTRPFRFVCYTDRDYEFKEPVEARPITMAHRNMFCLLEPFREDLGRVVFMGLDTIIVGNIDWLMDYRGPFTMLQDPYVPERDCSGVMAFPYTPQVWERFCATSEKELNQTTLYGYKSDMTFLADIPHERFTATHIGSDMEIRPRRGGIYSYKVHCKNGLPADACIVYFHGREKPHEINEPWVLEHWGEKPELPLQQLGKDFAFFPGTNLPAEKMLENARLNLKRKDVRLFLGQPEHTATALIVGGGPSLADSLNQLRMYKKRGGHIFALNAVHDYLIAKGITPDFQVILDARPDNVAFVQRPTHYCTYLIAGQCDPSVFDALKGRDVILWLGNVDGMLQVAEENADKPIAIISGGGTVGMKTIPLCYTWGYRRMRLFGFDSSYKGPANHAYCQPLNDKESVIEITAKSDNGNSKKFLCSRSMANQADYFIWLHGLMKDMGVEIHVHGDGLLPWLARNRVWENEAQEVA